MALTSGTRLGPYQIIDSIGAGGMGEVYRALDTRLDRNVAIKVLPDHLSRNPQLRQRFDREARALSNLQHPGICTLHDVGHESGVDFLVMEYLDGETLAQRLASGPMSLDDVLTTGTQITEALDAAHRAGVVHRDLKPGNVILTATGAKLLDFGLAKRSATEETPHSVFTQVATEAASEPLTQEGTILGTFQYMSPEQLEGAEADARSDIFSLGAVLHEMVTGHKAFEGKSQASLIAAIMQSQPPALSTVQPMSPPALERIVRTCLEKSPADRWQTAHDIAIQLRWVREGGSEAGVPRPVSARRRGRERIAWVIAVIAVAAAVALGVRALREPAPEEGSRIRFSIPAPAGVVDVGSPRISPDGRTIAFNGTDTTQTTRIWLRRLDSVEAVPLPGTEGCGRPFWSPDGRHLAYFVGEELERISIGGGPPLTLCRAQGYDGAWGRDVMVFDGSVGDSIRAVPVGGGEIRGVTRLDRARGDTGHGWPFFLPDGRRFLFVAMMPGADEIRLGEVGSFETTRVAAGDSRVEYVHPGYIVYEREGTLLAQPFDLDAGRVSGDPFALAAGIGVGGSGLAHFSGSSTGTLIYTESANSNRELLWLDREGHELGTVGEPAAYWHPALSPDEERLAVEVFGLDRVPDVWIFDLARGLRSRFTSGGRNVDPVWSPDGSRIVFTSDRDGTNALYVKKVDGDRTPRKLVERSTTLYAHDWAPDGRIVFLARSPTGLGLSTITLDEPDRIRPLFHTPATEGQGQVSPDGRYVAYTSDESGAANVYVTEFVDGGRTWQVSTHGGSEAMWRGDGRELFYLSPDRKMMAVDLTPGNGLKLGIPHALFRTPVQRDRIVRNRYVVSGDGQRFLVAAVVDRDGVPMTSVIVNWTAGLSDR